MLFALIFLAAFVALGVLALYLARNIEHGEARFDSKTGKPLGEEKPAERGPAVPARRIEDDDERNENA